MTVQYPSLNDENKIIFRHLTTTWFATIQTPYNTLEECSVVFVENLNNLTTRDRVSFYMYTYGKDPSRDNKLNFYVYMEFKKNCRGSYIINTLLDFDQNNVIAKILSGGSRLNISKFINVDFKECKELLYWQGVPKGEKPSRNLLNFSFITEFDLYEIALKNNTMPDLFKVKLKKDSNVLIPKILDTNGNSPILEILNTQELEKFKLLKEQKILSFKEPAMVEKKRRRKIKEIPFSEIPILVMKNKIFYLVRKDFYLNIEIFLSHYKSEPLKKEVLNILANRKAEIQFPTGRFIPNFRTKKNDKIEAIYRYGIIFPFLQYVVYSDRDRFMKNKALNWNSLKRVVLFIFQNSHNEAKTEVVKFDYLVRRSEYIEDKIYQEAFDACILSITNLKFERTYKKRFVEFMDGKFLG